MFSIRGKTVNGQERQLPSKAQTIEQAKRTAREFFRQDAANRPDSVWIVEIVDDAGNAVGEYSLVDALQGR